tara:strand:+ start:472 stop:657 length:186 start_codon:yes stop_codon:yes gene_type:complete
LRANITNFKVLSLTEANYSKEGFHSMQSIPGVAELGCLQDSKLKDIQFPQFESFEKKFLNV